MMRGAARNTPLEPVPQAGSDLSHIVRCNIDIVRRNISPILSRAGTGKSETYMTQSPG